MTQDVFNEIQIRHTKDLAKSRHGFEPWTQAMEDRAVLLRAVEGLQARLTELEPFFQQDEVLPL